MLALGLDLEDAAAGPLARADSASGGRDIGVVFNMPSRGGATVLPDAAASARSTRRPSGGRRRSAIAAMCCSDASYARSIAVAHGGDASTATNGFWSALNIATTLRLPLLFYIEDNGYGISVPSRAADARRQYRRQSRALRESRPS